MIPVPDVIAHTDVDANGLALVVTFAGEVQWTAETGKVVQLPTVADVEHIANQRSKSLSRDGNGPILVGRDVPTQEQLAMAEAAHELDPFAGDPEPPFGGRELVDVETGGRV